MSIITIKPNEAKIGFSFDRRQEFLLDSVDDFYNLPFDCAPGSKAYLADNSRCWMMGGELEWVECVIVKGDGTPHQYLVTDANGVAQWEDKPFGEKMEEVVVVEKITFTPEFTSARLVAPFREINVGQVYHVMLDGERYDVEAQDTGSSIIFASNGVFEVMVRNRGSVLDIPVTQVADSGFVGVEHTIEVLTTEETVKTIDPKYLPGGGLVKTAIFKGDQYDATVASLAAGATRPTTVWDTAFDCINMTHAEALAHIQSGGVLTALILTNGNSQLHPQALHATVRYAGSRDLSDLIEVYAYDDAGSNMVSYRWCLRWTADGIAWASTQTNKEPADDVLEWA